MPDFKKNNGNTSGGGGGEIEGRPKRHLIVEPRCNVCKSKFRKFIDNALVWGVPDAEIARQFEDEGLSRRSIGNHRSRHLDVEAAAYRKIIEEEANRRGENIERTKVNLLTRRSVADVVIMKGYNDIVSGAVQVEPHALVQFLNWREKQEEKINAIQLEDLQAEFQAFMQAVQKIVPPHMFEGILEVYMKQREQEKKAVDAFGMEVPWGQSTDLPSLDYGYDKRELDPGNE